MKHKKVKIISVLVLSLCMIAGLIPLFENPMMVNADTGTAPNVSQFATKEQLMSSFDLNNSTTQTVQKVIFGQNGSGAAKEWLIAGQDTEISGDNIVLFAATPLKNSNGNDLISKFQDEENLTLIYNYLADTGYGDTDNSIEVYANHYGASDLRQTLIGLQTNSSYFSSAEQEKMNDTTVYTNDTKNKDDNDKWINYTTTDKLYAAYGDYNYNNNKYITVGTNTAESLNGGLRIDIGNLVSSYFWLRSPYTIFGDGVFVAPASESAWFTFVNGMDVLVVPAFDLNLSSVLFASAANAASSSHSGDLADTMTANTFTLRYASSGSESAVLNGDGTQVKISGASDGMYLVVQNSDGAYAVNASSNPTICADSIMINSITLENFNNCKVWLESTNTDRIAMAKEAVQGYDVAITAGDYMAKDSESGEESQTGLTGAMTDVVYEAEEGYYFPVDYSISENGITVTRDKETKIVVSGTPTANAEITLKAATQKCDVRIINPEGSHITRNTAEGNGLAEQTGLTGAMTDVVYEAEEGYYFPEDYSISENGITVTRDSETKIVVDGTPTADTEITLKEATLKPVYGITISPSTINFGSKVSGYDGTPLEKIIMIKNTSNQEVTLEQPESDDNYVIGTLNQTTIAPDEEATLKVQPETGLPVGSYNRTLTIRTTHGDSATVELKFLVGKKSIKKKTGDHKVEEPQRGGSHAPKDTYVNPLSWGVTANPSGTFCLIEQQGPLCRAAFHMATPADFTEAFSFNLLTRGTDMIFHGTYDAKTGEFVLTIPVNYQSTGRTFILIGIDENGKTKLFADADNNDRTITVPDLNGFTGYAFSLIYK